MWRRSRSLDKENRDVLIVLFGLPGAGKTYVGEVFRDRFDCFFYDGDENLSEEMKEFIAAKKEFTDKMRDDFFEELVVSVGQLIKKHRRLVVAQTFIKEKYRSNLAERFPEAKFVLIETDTKLRENRLAKRTDLVLDRDYARGMVLAFEPPRIEHFVMSNNTEGTGNVKRQIESLPELF